MSEAAIWKDGRVYLEMDDDDLEAFELFMALALANKLPNARISIYQAASFDAWHWEAVRFLHRQGRGGFLGAKREAEELRQHMATHPDDEGVGYAPADDDLERCNCSLTGSMGHLSCGWDKERDMPRFVPGASAEKQSTDIERGSRR